MWHLARFARVSVSSLCVCLRFYNQNQSVCRSLCAPQCLSLFIFFYLRLSAFACLSPLCRGRSVSASTSCSCLFPSTFLSSLSACLCLPLSVSVRPLLPLSLFLSVSVHPCLCCHFLSVPPYLRLSLCLLAFVSIAFASVSRRLLLSSCTCASACLCCCSCLSACLPVCLPVRLSACRSLSQPVCLSACQLISQSVSLSVCQSVCLPVCLSVAVSLSL